MRNSFLYRDAAFHRGVKALAGDGSSADSCTKPHVRFDARPSLRRSDIPIWQRVPVTAPPAKPAAAPGAGGQHPGVLTWNTRTQDLVYGSADGSVQVFREGQ